MFWYRNRNIKTLLCINVHCGSWWGLHFQTFLSITITAVTWKLQKACANDDSEQNLRISDLVCYRNGLELSWGNRRFPTNFHGVGPGTRILDKELPVNVGGGRNSQLPYKSFPFRALLATEIREIAHCYNFRRRWLPAPLESSSKTAHWDRG